MSYALDVSPDAQTVWRALDVEVQEGVLDELDRLAAAPFDLPRGPAVRDLVVRVGPVRHYVFIQLSVNHARGVLSVYRIGHVARGPG